MNKNIRNLMILGVVIVLVAIFQPFFILSEGEQAVVTRLGKVVAVHEEAGLKIKVPQLDRVTKYSKKVLSWDGDPQRLPTSEKQYILVDTTARWRIVDPETFYRVFTTMEKAYNRLDTIIESSIRTTVSQYNLAESVRSSDIILDSRNAILDFETDKLEAQAAADIAQAAGEDADNANINAGFVSVDLGREGISDEILSRSTISMPEYGIELMDVVIRQIRYSEDLTESVYQRMISERNKVASGYRSDGEGQKAEWLGKLNRDRDIKLSVADREAAVIRAEGDAEAARIYAEAYRVDPEFYSFWKAMESYEEVLPAQKKILSTNMDFFKYLYQID